MSFMNGVARPQRDPTNRPSPYPTGGQGRRTPLTYSSSYDENQNTQVHNPMSSPSPALFRSEGSRPYNFGPAGSFTGPPLPQLTDTLAAMVMKLANQAGLNEAQHHVAQDFNLVRDSTDCSYTHSLTLS